MGKIINSLKLTYKRALRPNSDNVIDRNQEILLKSMVFYIAIISILLSVFIFFGIIFIGGRFDLYTFFIMISTSLLSILLWVLVDRSSWSRYRLSIPLFLMIMGVIITYQYGYSIVTFMIYTIVIITGILFSNGREKYILVAATLVISVLLVIVFKPVELTKDDSEYIITVTLSYYLLASVILHFFFDHYRKNLVELQKQKNELIDEISKRVETEKKILKQKHEQEELFLNMSHELRTPMNVIIGVIQLLQNPNLSIAEYREYIETLKIPSDGLLSIINDILNYSKVAEKALKRQDIEFNLKNTLENVVKAQRYRYDNKDLKLKLNIDNKVPLNLYGDKNKLTLIVNNLLSNAYKFTNKGYVSLSVSSKKIDKETVIFSFTVKDTGMGISPHAIPKIFNTFYQADKNLHPEVSGSGLGLAIVKKLTDLLGGKIKVESKLNSGTTFKLDLQFKVLNKEIIETEDIELNISSKKLKIKVLLVEDNELNQFVAKKLLERVGYEVDIAKDGFECLDMIKLNKYDIILMDLLMPKKDGFETASEIRRMDIQTPIIGVSAHTQSDVEEKIEKSGFNDFISKPFKIEALQKKIIDLTK